jgi:outer membrane protein OmpA-like peptidoglycan-associated protein
MLKNVVKVLCLAVVVSNFVLVGCTKKPKIDLTDLRNNPAGGSSALTDGPGFGDDGGFVPGQNGDGFDGNGLNGANGGLDGKGGAWVGTDQDALAGTVASDFLNGASKWEGIVYFAYDRAEVQPSERVKLDTLAQLLLADETKGVVIEGNCDDRGSDEYNRALSERRALSVKDYLMTLGVSENRMQTVSYGEDRPAVPNAQTEAEHQLNRRAEFLLGTLK